MPAAANRPRSAGSSSWTCSIRGMNGTWRGARLEGVERGPDRRIADRVDLRGDPAGRRSRDELAQPLGLGDPDAAPQVGRRAVARAPARCRPGARRSATRASRRRSTSASRSGPARRGRRRGPSPLRRPPASAVSSASSRSDAMHPDRQPAGLGQARVGRVRPRRGRGPARAPPGSWTATTPSATSSSETATMAASRSASAIGGMWTVTSRVAASCRTPSGFAVGVAPDDAAGRIGVSRSTPAASRPAWLAQQRVVVVRPQRAATARRDGLEVVGRRPAAPAVDVPAVALEPGVRDRPAPRERPGSAPGRRRASRRRSGRPGASRRRRAARWRCASVRPGIATWSGSRAIRSVNGSARVSR